ncbi:MAG: DNA polymerase III subunit delta [Acetobacteraceae bacterium]|nr:DNA polymerase III subunit delta [Acetobacteraceae bacterium]
MRRVGSFLRDPGGCRVLLLYGEDVGLIRERAEGLVRFAAGSLDDPFRVTQLAREAIGDLPGEAAAQALTGGRRAIRVRDVTDTVASVAAVKAVLEGRGEALVVLEGPGLASRSKLRTLLDGAADGAAIGCYPEDGRDLQATIRESLSAAGVSVEPEAAGWLAEQLGADRASTRAELEKLAVYVGAGGRVDLDAAQACVGDLAGLSMDDALYAATAGDVELADRALEVAAAEGFSAVGVIRQAMGHMQRLHRARLAMVEQGLSAAEAMRGVRPPVFFRRVAVFTRALEIWPPSAIAAALARLNEAERGCKRTGWPDQTLARAAILTIARRAAAHRRSRR